MEKADEETTKAIWLGMSFEESLANVNKIGKQSIILELEPKASDFLGTLVGVEIDLYKESGSTILDVLLILDGQASEDYLITGSTDSSHDIDQLERMCDEYNTSVTRAELETILKGFTSHLRKRVITWG